MAPDQRTMQEWWNALTTPERCRQVSSMLDRYTARLWDSWTHDWDQLRATQRLMLARYYESNWRRRAINPGPLVKL